MHIGNIMTVLFFAAWFFGGMILLREARGLPKVGRWMAYLAVLLGPFGMLIYLGIRYTAGQAVQARMLEASRQHRVE